MSTFQSQGGQGGGAPASSTRVSEARTTATGSSGGAIATASAAASVAQAAQSWTQAAASTSSITQTVTNTVQTSNAQSAADQVIQRQFAATAFMFNMGRCCATGSATSNAPYLPAAFATGSDRIISPVMGYRVASVDVANRAPYFQWGIDISGDGANQTSWFFVMTGALVEDNNDGFALSSGFGATRRGAANQSMGRASGAVSSQPNTVTLDTARLPLSGEVWQNDFVATTRQYREIQAFYFPGGGGANVNYNFTQQFTRLPTSAGLGSNRPAEVLTGWTGGLMRTINFPANGSQGAFIAPTFATVGVATVQLDPSLNRMQANFNVANVTPSENDTFQFGQFQMGSLNTSLRARSAYVDYENFAAREAVVVNNSRHGAPADLHGQRPEPEQLDHLHGQCAPRRGPAVQAGDDVLRLRLHALGVLVDRLQSQCIERRNSVGSGTPDDVGRGTDAERQRGAVDRVCHIYRPCRSECQKRRQRICGGRKPVQYRATSRRGPVPRA